MQVSAAGRRGSPGSGLAACLRRQVKGRAGHQFELALSLPRARPSSLPVVTALGLATGGSGSRWHTGPVRGWELLESPGLNVRLHALNLPLLPSGTAANGTTRLLHGLSTARQRGGGQGEPGSTSLEGDGEVRNGLVEPRMSGFNGVQKKGSFALIGRRGWGQELCTTSTRSCLSWEWLIQTLN